MFFLAHTVNYRSSFPPEQKECRLQTLLTREMWKGTVRAYTAILRKVVRKNVHTTIWKGNMGYAQYTVPDTVAVESTFVPFL